LARQNISVFAALYDDGGEGTMLEVDQIGFADYYQGMVWEYVTATTADVLRTSIGPTHHDCSVTLQNGWLPSPTLTLAFMETMSEAVDASTFPAEIFCVQGFLEVEWRQVSPERLRSQALARVFEKGG
jgi:hypothetical protein